MKGLKLFSLLAVVSITSPLLGMASRLHTPLSRTHHVLSAATLSQSSVRSFGSWRNHFDRFMWGSDFIETRQQEEQYNLSQKMVASLHNSGNSSITRTNLVSCLF